MTRQRTRRTSLKIERAIEPSAAIVLDFLTASNRVVRVGYAFARSNILPVVSEERRAYHGDEAGDNLRAYILQLRGMLNEQVANAERAIGTASVAEASRFDRKFTAAIGAAANIDITALIRDDDLVDLLALRTSEHVSLVRSISEDVFSHIERTSLGSILEGRGNRETEKLLAGLEGIDRRRARLIARDQASKLNGAMNQFRQEQAGVTHYEWSTTLDGRERPTHHRNHGKTFPWAKAPSTGHPGHEINCFVGSTNVDLSNGCHKLWRRLYGGPLTTVETSEGTFLQATPNHPILTGRGWLAINDLQEGDYLVKVVKGGGVDELDRGQLVASFRDLFEAAEVSEGAQPSTMAPSDFHGDGSKGDVDTVALNGLLPDRLVSALSNGVENLLLSGADIDAPGVGLNGQGALGARSDEVFSLETADLGMSGGGIGPPLGCGHLAHSDEICGGSTSPRNASLVQDARDNVAGDAVSGGDSLNAFAGPIEPDDLVLGEGVVSIVTSGFTVCGGVDVGPPSAERLAEAAAMASKCGRRFFECGPGRYEFERVIEKSVGEFSGHVFNLESSTGWYAANHIVAHNCRCRAKAIIIDDEETAAEFVGEPKLEGLAPIAENGAAIRSVGSILGEQVLTLPREQLLIRQAQVRQTQTLLASLKGATERVQEDLEAFYERLYGHAAGELPDGILIARSRSTQLRRAIAERLDIIEDVLSHALIYGGAE